MSKWVDRFKEHAIQQIIIDFEESLQNSDFSETVSEDDLLDVARLNKVLVYIKTVLKSVDPDLISIQPINEMQGQLQSSFNEYNNFKANENTAHLTRCNNHIDNALNMLSRTFVFYKKPIKADITSIIEAYSTKTEELLVQHRTSTKSKIESIQEDVNKVSSDLSNANSDLTTLNEDLTNTKQQIQTQITEFGTQFQSSQESRSSKFDESIKDFHDKMDDEFKSLSTKSMNITDIMTKLKDDAETVFGVVQNTVQAGAHKSYATEEKALADKFRFSAIVLMVISCAILVLPTAYELYVLFQKASENNTNIVYDWISLLKRLPISLVLFAPAYYLAKESTKHRNNANLYRKTELVLRTIDPYLALIDDENKRDELKADIAKLVFGGTTAPNEVDAESISLKDLKAFIRLMPKTTNQPQ